MGDPASSIVMGMKPFKANGTSSVVVEDEEKKPDATIVVIDGEGRLAAQCATVVGKEGA